jgi:hypothetical protein
MEQKEYQYLKDQFLQLTGKQAEDNLEAFFSYTNTMLLMDMKDLLKIIRLNQKDPNAGVKP